MVERHQILSALLGGLLLAGCSLRPAYTRPEAPVSDTYPVATGERPDGETAAADLGWRDVFGDERLQVLVSLALESNRDLRVAALNVERVRALHRIQRSPLLPGVGASASASFQTLPSSIPGSEFIPRQQYSVNLGVTNWELDFFGRVRNLSEEALQQYFATAEARRSAHLALVAQVATTHFEERALFEQLALARKTLDTVEASARITTRAFEVGTASELDQRTAESQVQSARYHFAFYEQRHAQALNALVFLVGRPLPEDLPDGKPLVEAEVIADLPAGLPSDLLTRRPDILAAEHKLLGANASIGAARAAFFPSISLTGAGGLSSTDLVGLFSGSAFTWNFIPRINVPIFQGGALKAKLEVAKISESIEVATYERSIQAAFREVADALVARESIEKQHDAQRRRVVAEEQRYRIAEMRYREGIERYVTLLTAQRDLYAAQQGLIDAQLSRLTNVATLYRALGGGWEEQTRTAPAGDTR